MNTSRVEVSVTFKGALMTTTITKDSIAYRDHDETEAALFYDIIDLARRDLRVPEEDVWIFGQEDEPDEPVE